MPDAVWSQGEAQAAPRVNVDGPTERVAKAIEGRDPKGYTEVRAADVVALAEVIEPERNNGVPDELARGARRALKGVKAHRVDEIVVYQLTNQLAQLLAALKA
jgi:hypothetical protein